MRLKKASVFTCVCVLYLSRRLSHLLPTYKLAIDTHSQQLFYIGTQFVEETGEIESDWCGGPCSTRPTLSRGSR